MKPRTRRKLAKHTTARVRTHKGKAVMQTKQGTKDGNPTRKLY
jgi:hypothetical protein